MKERGRQKKRWGGGNSDMKWVGEEDPKDPNKRKWGTSRVVVWREKKKTIYINFIYIINN